MIRYILFLVTVFVVVVAHFRVLLRLTATVSISPFSSPVQQSFLECFSFWTFFSNEYEKKILKKETSFVITQTARDKGDGNGDRSGGIKGVTSVYNNTDI